MKILLLIVGLALVCHLQAQDNSEMSGEWFTVSLASDHPDRIAKGGSLEKFVKHISVVNGIITGVFFKRVYKIDNSYLGSILKSDDSCIEFIGNSFNGKDGEMYFYYDGLNRFSIKALDREYMIITLINYSVPETIKWAELYGRTSVLPDEIKEKFADICEEFGIERDQIRDVSNEDRCDHLRAGI